MQLNENYSNTVTSIQDGNISTYKSPCTIGVDNKGNISIFIYHDKCDTIEDFVRTTMSIITADNAHEVESYCFVEEDNMLVLSAVARALSCVAKMKVNVELPMILENNRAHVIKYSNKSKYNIIIKSGMRLKSNFVNSIRSGESNIIDGGLADTIASIGPASSSPMPIDDTPDLSKLSEYKDNVPPEITKEDIDFLRQLKDNPLLQGPNDWPPAIPCTCKSAENAIGGKNACTRVDGYIMDDRAKLK